MKFLISNNSSPRNLSRENSPNESGTLRRPARKTDSKLTLSVAFGLFALLLASCAPSISSTTPPSYYLSHHPDDTKSRPLRHYPVARQGNLTAWVTSGHVRTPTKWLYRPDDPSPKHPIVGNIGPQDMPADAKHDGALLIVSGYNGPIFNLWEGLNGEGKLFTGNGGWVPVRLEQPEWGVNTWVLSKSKIGGWSGYPVVIGDPNRPEAVVGAMWYRHNHNQTTGGTTSSRFLKTWIAKLKFSDFVKKGN